MAFKNLDNVENNLSARSGPNNSKLSKALGLVTKAIERLSKDIADADDLIDTLATRSSEVKPPSVEDRSDKGERDDRNRLRSILRCSLWNAAHSQLNLSSQDFFVKDYAARKLSLIFDELAIHSTRHGAIGSGAAIDVSWHIAKDELGVERLWFFWTEVFPQTTTATPTDAEESEWGQRVSKCVLALSGNYSCVQSTDFLDARISIPAYHVDH